ncbi:MAG: chorismate synthase, partial [Oscillospiraceae bacterium]
MQSNYIGAISLNLFGQSHGEAIGIVINGLAPGITIDYEYINNCLEKRKAKGNISTKRKEADQIKIVSGVFNGKTTGSPLTIIIENENTQSKDYSALKDTPRPSHADYSARVKYQGFEDYRGGGHFSGRITAPFVAAGAIFKKILEDKDIFIASHILSSTGVYDDEFSEDEIILKNQIIKLIKSSFPTLNSSVKDEMIKNIENLAKEGDSCGGILQTAVCGMPAGIGEPFFSSIESKLSSLLFSIPAVKGVEFGAGFNFSNLTGSVANDAFYYDKNGNVKTKTNNNGGVNGGISNSMPILIKTAFKPTPSIYKPQQTVN